MIRPLFLMLALLSATAPALAAERTYSVSNFDRIRVEGPFEVRLSTKAAPGGSAEADPRILDQLRLIVEGTTLIVRLGGQGWGETPKTATRAPVITLRTPGLRSALVVAGGRLTIGRMTGQRIDLAINGNGSIAVEDVDADEFNATVIGAGTMTIAGTARRARLLTNGSGTIEATDLVANDLTVRLDGNGETRSAARYTAKVTTNGLGRVVVAGNPSCTVQALAGGPVECGAGKP